MLERGKIGLVILSKRKNLPLNLVLTWTQDGARKKSEGVTP
jgi:hypothetical protein